MWLAVRSLFWAILFPGVVAGYVPWQFFGVGSTPGQSSPPMPLLGAVCVVLGATLLIVCIVDFARRGRGTLSPVDPPRQLVVRGPYQYVRNPMYLGVATVLLGEMLWAPSVGLAVYAILWFTVVNLFVIGYEEPYLRDRFGASFDTYARQVSRWIPRLSSRHSSANL
jgi:protein-S-isoprenylcysteine O-methyltransferase Ste14